MSWLEKAKVWLGVVDAEDIEGEDEPRAQLRVNPRDKSKRPPLDDIKPPPQESIEDALVAREAGDLEEMRRLLSAMDRGHGLRLVLRAAAALEAGDDDTVNKLLPRVRGETPAWRLPLQVAAAVDDEALASSMRRTAEQAGAPGWSLAWLDACASDAERQRQGLVALLFADISLARTVAARDLSLPDAVDDPAAAKRYVTFAHGRDIIRRFGADIVAALMERAAR